MQLFLDCSEGLGLRGWGGGVGGGRGRLKLSVAPITPPADQLSAASRLHREDSRVARGVKDAEDAASLPQSQLLGMLFEKGSWGEGEGVLF